MGEEAGEQPRPSSESAAEIKETTSVDGNSWPAVHYDVAPCRTYHFFQQFRTTASNPNNFLKGVKWSPDGSCFLTCSDDNTLRVFSLPYNDSCSPENVPTSMPDSDSYVANRVVSEGESVYDYCWYPYMSTSNPDLCVFATSTRDHPIHLWDSNSGQLRCTYRAYDAMDEITAAFSIGFNPNGNNQTTAIYREDNMELLYVLHGQEGGVTQDPYVLCWDIRKTVDIVYKLYRSSEGTNQRIQFDIEPLGRYLGTGGQDGLVHVYDLQTGEWVSSFQAALDTVNGLAFHPFLPMAATSSGHRRYGGLDDSQENNSLSGDENCVSVWSFFSSTGDDASSGEFGN